MDEDKARMERQLKSFQNLIERKKRDEEETEEFERIINNMMSSIETTRMYIRVKNDLEGYPRLCLERKYLDRILDGAHTSLYLQRCGISDSLLKLRRDIEDIEGKAYELEKEIETLYPSDDAQTGDESLTPPDKP